MKQLLLRFAFPEGKRIYINEFREALAKSEQLPAEFFGYDKETGKPQRQLSRREDAARQPTAMELANPYAIPAIRIVGGKTWVGILAMETQRHLLDQSVMVALKVLNNHFGTPVAMQLEEREMGIEQQYSPFPYFVREMVLRHGANRETSNDALKELVKKRLQDGLARQAQWLGVDCPSNSALAIHVTEVIRPRGLRLVTANKNDARTHLTLLDVKFMADVKLGGIWLVGGLTSRGYGRIGYDLAALGNPRSEGAQ